MATTITIDDSTLERFKRLKAELDETQQAPDHTNESFLRCLMDTYEAAQDGYYEDSNDQLMLSEVDEIAEQLATEIDSMAFNGQIADDKADRILGRLDDLESQIPKKTAEELR